MRMKTLFHFKAKVIEPCSKFLSIFKSKSDKPLRTPTFRMSNRRSKPKRTKVVRFRKPFSIKAFRLPHCRPKSRSRPRKNRPSLASRFKKSFRRKKHTKVSTKPVQKVRIAHLLTVLFSLRKTKDVDTESCDQGMGDATESCDQGMGDARSASPSEGGHAKEPFPSPITPGYVRISDDSKKESSDDLEDVEDACKSFESYMVEMIIEEQQLKDLMDVEELLYCWRNLKSPVFIDLVSRFYGELCMDLFSPSDENESFQTSDSQVTNNTSE